MNADRWASLSFIEQMANIGSEVGRTAKWVAKGKPQMAEGAFVRALDLLDLTIAYGRAGQPNRDSMLKELCRCRECFCDAYMRSDAQDLAGLDRYFGVFAMAYARH